MNYTTAKLGDLITPAPTKRAGKKEYPILSITMRSGLIDQSKKFKKRVASKDTSQYKVVEDGQLVVGFPIDEGLLSFQNMYPEATVSPAYSIWNCTPDINKDYLEKYLRSPRAIAYYSSKMKGSTARRRNLAKDDFLNLPVPVFSRENQEKISQWIRQTDYLRSQRKRSIELVKELADSIFLDMFGDPESNTKSWKRVPLRDITESIDSGKSPKCLSRPAEEGEWGVLKLGAVTSCDYLQEENKALPQNSEFNPAHEIQPGDLLFTRKNTPDLVAACALVGSTPPRLLMPDLIFRINLKYDSQVTKNYLHRLLVFPTKRRKIQGLAGGSAASMSNISKSRLLEVPIEIPPLDLQQKFNTKILNIQALKNSHQAHLARLDELFASVQQRAFDGTLWDDRDITV